MGPMVSQTLRMVIISAQNQTVLLRILVRDAAPTEETCERMADEFPDVAYHRSSERDSIESCGNG